MRVFESSSTHITDLYKSKESQKAKKVVFSQFGSKNLKLRDNGIELHINYGKDVLNKQLIEFNKKEIILDLSKKKFENNLFKHRKMEYTIDTFDKIKGNVFKFLIRPESPLEAISDIIKLQSHIQYVGNSAKTKLVSKQ